MMKLSVEILYPSDEITSPLKESRNTVLYLVENCANLKEKTRAHKCMRKLTVSTTALVVCYVEEKPFWLLFRVLQHMEL